MREVILKRIEKGPDGVFGIWGSDSGLKLVTAELPEFGDLRDKSCIDPNDYFVKKAWSEKHQANLFHVQDKTRDDIEIHSANVPLLQLLGCIAPGKAITTFVKGTVLGTPPHELILDRDYRGVTDSRNALKELMDDLPDCFMLHIVE